MNQNARYLIDANVFIQAKNEFAKAEVADAFLIAVAKAHNCTIVTQEASKPDSKKRVLIPDAARVFKLESIMIYDLLSQHATGNFTFTL